MEKIKKVINLENVLCIFLIICPILDMASFIFRNNFNVNFSPSTFIRPIIPIILAIIIFFKENKKFKLYMFFVGLIYLIYGIAHLFVFEIFKTGSSYSNVIHEAQYIVNYTFMILNLFIFIYVFKDKNLDKIKKSIAIMSLIYILSIFIAIFTKTSSSTYIEGMGYKGWFESGNSIGSILILTMFIYLSLLKDKKFRFVIIPIVVLVGIYLSLLLGTRVGLFGFILVLMCYIFVEILYKIIHKAKINKRVVAIMISGIAVVLLVVITVGSVTLQRRKHLSDIEQNIQDEKTSNEAHVTGSILEIKEKIEENTLEEGYMNEPQKKSILELYDICNNLNVKNNDQRMQQLIYNVLLVKNQKSIVGILFGNGYMNNFRELVLEMEIPAFLLNFGVIGFILFFIPFLAIFIYSVYIGFKNIKKIDKEYMMLCLGGGFVFALSFFAGYTFFNSSTMMVIITIYTLLINKILNLKRSSK